MKKRIQRGFTLVELMIVVAIIGILAAIAIPNFIRFQARSKQSEAKVNLKALYSAETAFYSTNDSYRAGMNEVGFAPERGNRYAYTTAATPAAWEPRSLVLIAPATAAITGIEVDTAKFAGTPAQPAPPTSAGAPVWTAEGAGATAVATCPDVVAGGTGTFCAFATGNIDTDTNTDRWVIGAGMSATLPAGPCWSLGTFTSGTPFVVADDVSC